VAQTSFSAKTAFPAARASSGGSRLAVLTQKGITYDDAGVSLDTAGAVLGRLRGALDSTRTPAVVGEPGGFAALYALDEQRLLAASTDGVGSKLMLARRAGRLRWAGADLAAHCINDVLTTGADPLFLLDYVAAGRIALDEVAELVEGAAAVCREAGCALVGGETAELPGIYRPGELDFAGTCVGLVERDRLVDGSRVEEGDVVLGLRSSGLHANGFSLVRRLVGDDDFDADLLLPPTRLYLEDVRCLRASADVRALAHVTGGGIAANLARVLPDGLVADLDWDWQRPAVFDWLAEHGVAEEEMRRVFNCGVGMCAVMPAAGADAVALDGVAAIGRIASA
jgi:phosphoribosylformylglycinamidine cyclo-ligase